MAEIRGFPSPFYGGFGFVGITYPTKGNLRFILDLRLLNWFFLVVQAKGGLMIKRATSEMHLSVKKKDYSIQWFDSLTEGYS